MNCDECGKPIKSNPVLYGIDKNDIEIYVHQKCNIENLLRSDKPTKPLNKEDSIFLRSLRL